MRPSWPFVIAGLAAVVGLSVCCFVPTYPVRGRVLVAGEPAVGAIVEFHPIGGVALAARPTGRVLPDGSFTLSTGPDRDGAPPGEYAVTVIWRESLAAGGERASGPNRLPAAYSRPGTTPLRASVIEGDNRIPPLLIEHAGGAAGTSSERTRKAKS